MFPHVQATSLPLGPRQSPALRPSPRRSMPRLTSRQGSVRRQDAARPAATAKSYGFYSKGCFAGGVAIATDGPTWQAMRLSRNRRWGHPTMIKLIQQLSRDAVADGWLAGCCWATSRSRAAARCCPAMPRTRSASMPTSG